MFTASLIDVPRPLVDPISCLIEAVGVASLAVRRPLRCGTIIISMNQNGCGQGIIATQPVTRKSAHSLIGLCSGVPNTTRVVLVSTRTQPPINPDDVELLHHLTHLFSTAGITLVDWVVVGYGGLYCPRSLTDMPDPWDAAVRFGNLF